MTRHAAPRPLAERFHDHPDETHVWVIRTDSVEEPLFDLLSPEERGRADRFRFVTDRRRFAAGQAALRQLLGIYAGLDPRVLRIRRTDRGKPLLDHPSAGVHFNISRSGDYSLVALAHAALGVDVERIASRAGLMDIAAAYFRPEETEHLRTRPQTERLRTFYRYWTIKEAWLKAEGSGLGVPLDRVAVELDRAPARVHAGSDCERYCEELDIAPGYAAALVVEKAMAAISVFEFGAA